LKSTNSWLTASFHHFWSIWRMQIIWSVVGLFHRKPRCLSSFISVVYRINIKRRILYKITRVVDKSERSLCIHQLFK